MESDYHSFFSYILPCEQCIEEFGQEPNAHGDSSVELNAYEDHLSNHGRYTRHDAIVSILATERRAKQHTDLFDIRSQQG